MYDEFVLNPLEYFESTRRCKLTDKRQAARFPLTDWLRVCPYPVEELGRPSDGPSPKLMAKGHDVSKSGIAFYLAARPTAKTYIIELGQDPNAIRVLAEVVRVQEGYWDRQRQFRVGCKFLMRMAD